MKRVAPSYTDTDWNAEDCLKFLELLGDLLHAWRKVTGNEVEMPTQALAHMGQALIECSIKIRTELEKGGRQ